MFFGRSLDWVNRRILPRAWRHYADLRALDITLRSPNTGP